MSEKIKLGDKVKDIVSGLTGIAIGRTTWLNGCDRITVQPIGWDKDKKPFESFTADEPQLVSLMKVKKIKRGRRNTGGPIPKQIKYGY